MTREETVNLIRSIVSLYPNWKPDNLTETVNAWHWALEDYPAVGIKAALQIYIKMQTGEGDITKSIMMLIGACLFMIGAYVLFPAFFGYNII